MTSETDKQIERLEARMSAATVEEVSTGVYEVFVPGAAREVTVVKADSEDEAKQKVQSVLANKIQPIKRLLAIVMERLMFKVVITAQFQLI